MQVTEYVRVEGSAVATYAEPPSSDGGWYADGFYVTYNTENGFTDLGWTNILTVEGNPFTYYNQKYKETFDINDENTFKNYLDQHSNFDKVFESWGNDDTIKFEDKLITLGMIGRKFPGCIGK
ncbi:hypothetical protein B5F37_00650 [Drancourtella sp. An210]|nr:hypothetical protein B5F37_00650 [Drancourtella sp. An210]